MHDLLWGVDVGDLYPSVSHFLRADYLTLKEKRGGSESALKRRWRWRNLISQPCPSQKSWGHEDGERWSEGRVCRGHWGWRMGMRLGSNFMYLFRLPCTDLGSSNFPESWTQMSPFPLFPSPSAFPSGIQKSVHSLNYSLNVAYGIRPDQYLLTESNKWTNGHKICYTWVPYWDFTQQQIVMATARCHGSPAIAVLHSHHHLWATALARRQSLDRKGFESGGEREDHPAHLPNAVGRASTVVTMPCSCTDQRKLIFLRKGRTRRKSGW